MCPPLGGALRFGAAWRLSVALLSLVSGTGLSAAGHGLKARDELHPLNAAEPAGSTVTDFGVLSSLTATWDRDTICADFVLTGSAIIVELSFTRQAGSGAFTTVSGTGPTGEILDQVNGQCSGSATSQSCIAVATGDRSEIRACASTTGFGPGDAVVVSGSMMQLFSTQVVLSTTVYSPALVDVSIVKYEDLNGDGLRQDGVDAPVAGQTFCVVSIPEFPCSASLAIGVTDSQGMLTLSDVPLGGPAYLVEAPQSTFTSTSPGGAGRLIDPGNPPQEAQVFLNFWYGRLSGRLVHDWFGLGMAGPGACPVDSYPDGAVCVPCSQGAVGAPCGSYPTSLVLRINEIGGRASTAVLRPAADGTFAYDRLPGGTYTLALDGNGFVLSVPPGRTVTSRSTFDETLYYYIPPTYSWRPIDGVTGLPVTGGSSTISCLPAEPVPNPVTGDNGIIIWSGVSPGRTCSMAYGPPAGWLLASGEPAEFVTRSGDALTVEIPLQRSPLSIQVTKRVDVRGDGAPGPSDPPLGGVTICADLGLDGQCGPDDPAVVTDASGEGTLVVQGTRRLPFDLVEVFDPQTTVPTQPAEGRIRIDPATWTPGTSFGFLNALYASVEIEVFRDRYLQGASAPACPFGEQPDTSGTGCEACEAGPAGDLCRTRPASLVFDRSPACTDCAIPFEPIEIPIVNGVAVAGRVPPGLYDGRLPEEELATVLEADPDRISSGETVRPRYRVWQTASAVVRIGTDRNANGELGPGEGLTGASVLFTGPRSAGGPDESVTVQVDADGIATLSGLIPGSPVGLTLQAPFGWVADPRQGGTTTILPESGGSSTATFLVVPGAWDLEVRAYADLDADGAVDAGEPPLDDVVVDLLSQSGMVLGTASTGPVDLDENGTIDPENEHGIVLFRVETGVTYGLRQRLPDGMRQTDPVPPGTYEVQVGPTGAPVPIYYFGNIPHEMDFGDAPEGPDSNRPGDPYGYPVRIGRDGARHLVVPGVSLGASADHETDGQPTSFADGDGEDEDGVEFTDDFSTFILRAEAHGARQIDVPGAARGSMNRRLVFHPSAAGRLDAWIDWNRDGDWDDAGEQIFDSEPLAAPSDTKRVSIPLEAIPGITYARFRFSMDGELGPRGYAPTGEVEDHAVAVAERLTLTSAADAGDAIPGDGICDTGNGECTLRAAMEEAVASGMPTWIDLSGAGKASQGVIMPGSALPTVTAPLIIDGHVSAILDGSMAGPGTNGFNLATDGITVSGVTIRSFGGSGVSVSGSRNTVRLSRVERNGLDGVRVVSGTGNRIASTSFVGNALLGIDIGADGPTAAGRPVIERVSAENGHVLGTLTGEANAPYQIELFVSATCDDSGFGEGEFVLDRFPVVTAGNGLGEIDRTLPEPVAIGSAITATATGADGSTSEFSQCMEAVTTGNQAPVAQDTPTEYLLDQNYPNPFNPSTRIEFSAPETARVRLGVYDLLGRSVRILMDETVSAGRHSTVFNADGLRSGVYLYRLDSPSGSVSKLLFLLK